ncbi:MAG: hypothetical protein M1812_003405 [Candelaria pacifica]|nr:MAG: hypothetical protein M1812_003405 [Candelaria pacifica]
MRKSRSSAPTTATPSGTPTPAPIATLDGPLEGGSVDDVADTVATTVVVAALVCGAPAAAEVGDPPLALEAQPAVIQGGGPEPHGKAPAADEEVPVLALRLSAKYPAGSWKADTQAEEAALLAGRASLLVNKQRKNSKVAYCLGRVVCRPTSARTGRYSSKVRVELVLMLLFGPRIRADEVREERG